MLWKEKEDVKEYGNKDEVNMKKKMIWRMKSLIKIYQKLSRKNCIGGRLVGRLRRWNKNKDECNGQSQLYYSEARIRENIGIPDEDNDEDVNKEGGKTEADTEYEDGYDYKDKE